MHLHTTRGAVSQKLYAVALFALKPSQEEMLLQVELLHVEKNNIPVKCTSW